MVAVNGYKAFESFGEVLGFKDIRLSGFFAGSVHQGLLGME